MSSSIGVCKMLMRCHMMSLGTDVVLRAVSEKKEKRERKREI